MHMKKIKVLLIIHMLSVGGSREGKERGQGQEMASDHIVTGLPPSPFLLKSRER